MSLHSHDGPSPGPRQLVATLGPASHALARELAEAGATAFRLNASHLPPPALADVLDRLRGSCPQVPVVVDLQGAKMRLGAFEPLPVAPGQMVCFTPDGSAGLPLPHPVMFQQARQGQTLSVDDGRIRLDIVDASAGRLEAVARAGGLLQPRKGVNVEPHPIVLGGLTAMDSDACRAAADRGVRTFAFSFVRTGEEASWVREQVPGCAVIGKVERQEATERLGAIAAAVDAIWICRGDLGAQLGPARLARFVASVEPPGLPCPVLMAGQVLERLTRHPEPSRSELCHLHDLLARGYAGIVLSDETAIGADPIRAVTAAAALLAALG